MRYEVIRFSKSSVQFFAAVVMGIVLSIPTLSFADQASNQASTSRSTQSVVAIAAVAKPSRSQEKSARPSLRTSSQRMLIEKINMGSGEILPGYERRETCRVHSDRVDIERVFGIHEGSQLRSDTRIDSTVTSNIDWVITRAKNEPLMQRPNDLCDAPETVIRAFEPGSHEEVILFRSGGCGSPRTHRDGAASESLRDLVGAHCSTTYDFGRE